MHMLLQHLNFVEYRKNICYFVELGMERTLSPA